MQVQARAEEAMKRSSDVAHLEWLEPESDEGNVEYKLRLKDPSTMRFQQLVTQMKFRLSEGNGECFYYLGRLLWRMPCCQATLSGRWCAAGRELWACMIRMTQSM